MSVDKTTGLTNEILKGLMTDALVDRCQLIVDMNDCTLPAGIYRTSPSTLNLPEGVYLYGLAEIVRCTWGGTQYLRETYVSDSGEFLFRLYWGDTIGWRCWMSIQTQALT